MQVCLALIHNNNAQRNAYIQPRLEELGASLAQKWPTRMIEVSAQPEIRPHGLPMAFLRDVMYESLGRDWQRYRLLRSRTFRGTLGFLLRSYRKYKRAGGGAGSAAALSRRLLPTSISARGVRFWTRMRISCCVAKMMLCSRRTACNGSMG
jgi:hypothetical protein